MHRNTLLNLLAAYKPTPDELEFKEGIITFVNDNHDCFERSLAIGHITASCWLLNKDHSMALLMHHAKLDKWFQLGGHCDGDADALRVALKEAQEESGINNIAAVSDAIFDIDIHLIPENKKEKSHYHYDIRFLLHVTSDESIVQNNESKELRWIGKDRLQLPTDNQAVVRLFSKWLQIQS